MADGLEDLLDLLDEARVEDRFSQLDMAKVTGTLGHVFCARLAFELAVDRSEKGIVEAAIARLGARLIHGLRIDDVLDAHALDLLGREHPKLYLLDRLERRTRVRKVEVRHLDVRRRWSGLEKKGISTSN